MKTDPFKKIQQFFLQQKAFHYKKRETVLFTKDVPLGVFYIMHGYVRSYLLSKEGKELTVTLLKPYDVFPMHWVINDVLTAHYYETLTNVEMYRAPKVSFLDFLKNNPDVFFYTTGKILARLNNASERMEAAILGNASAKMAGMLSFLADHVGTTTGHVTVIDIPFTHRDIASLIGLTRETVSLEMEKLEKQGVIELRNHQLIIKKWDLLKELSSTE